MRYLFIRWIINAVAIGLTAWLMPRVHIEGNILLNLILISAIFGLVNAIIRPIILFFTCPLIILTLGLFTLVINALMLSLTAWLVPTFSIDGFWTTFFASLIISIISAVLGLFLHDERRVENV